jgi:hypothetical protein
MLSVCRGLSMVKDRAVTSRVARMYSDFFNPDRSQVTRTDIGEAVAGTNITGS